MDITLPRIPDELWREHIFPSLQSISSHQSLFKIELMLRIGSKRKINKTCIENLFKYLIA